jgi:lipoate-protein ligase A
VRSRALAVWQDGARRPSANMALDELLLSRPGPPVLRLYAWEPAGLSLGRFQDPAWFADVPGRHELVRRVTGGGAIYHEHELTFALTGDAEILPGAIGASYDLVHGALARALAAVGVPVHAATGTVAAPCARGTERWCFARPGRHDLVTAAGRKIVGSAQRRVRRPAPRILHHGSIVLRAPSVTPCGAVADHVEPAAVLAALRQRVAAELAAALRLTLVPAADALPAQLIGRSRGLAASDVKN